MPRDGGTLGSLYRKTLFLFVDLSSDSQFALTGGSDGIVRIWNTISGDCVAIPPSSALYGVTVVTLVS